MHFMIEEVSIKHSYFQLIIIKKMSICLNDMQPETAHFSLSDGKYYLQKNSQFSHL